MTLFGFITGYEPGYEHGYKYDKSSKNGAWTRKGAHHKVGSDDYRKPSRKVSVRSSQHEQARPVYYPEQEGRFVEEPIQYQPQEVLYNKQAAQYQEQAALYNQYVPRLQQQYPHGYDHPAQVPQHDSGFHEEASRSRQSSAHLSRRQTVHCQPEPRERNRYPDDPVSQGSIRRSATHSNKHIPPPSRSHQGTHRSVQYPNHPSSQPTHRSGSRHLEPVYEGRERRSVQPSHHESPRQSHRESAHHGESHHQSHHGSSHHASQADQGRQFTVHNDFASKAPGHTGSARNGSGKQKAKLYGGNKEMTLADF